MPPDTAPGTSSQAPKTPILLVEDTTVLAKTYIQYLRNEPYEITHVVNGQDAIAHLKEHVPRAVLLDLQLPDISGMEVLAYVREQEMPCPVIMITAHGSINAAVDAMKAGAFDFVVKPFAAERIIVTLGNAIERQKLEDLVETYRQEIDRDGFHQIIGTAPPMQAVYRIIENAADSKASIFIKGESGTGKEVTAEAIHQQSKRRQKPFVALNCAAIPKDLMESEIFGHVKGAFTSAVSDRQGAAAQADGGTLFLDEICEMDINLQAKLLRFIQTETFQKVGGSTTEQVDVRFVCATNRDPFGEVQKGNFREDLYYRLHVIPIELPPLRDRGDDMLEIARHFLNRYAREEGKGFTAGDNAPRAVPANRPRCSGARRRAAAPCAGHRRSGHAAPGRENPANGGNRTGSHRIRHRTMQRQHPQGSRPPRHFRADHLPEKGGLGRSLTNQTGDICVTFCDAMRQPFCEHRRTDGGISRGWGGAVK